MSWWWARLLLRFFIICLTFAINRQTDFVATWVLNQVERKFVVRPFKLNGFSWELGGMRKIIEKEIKSKLVRSSLRSKKKMNKHLEFSANNQFIRKTIFHCLFQRNLARKQDWRRRNNGENELRKNIWKKVLVKAFNGVYRRHVVLFEFAWREWNQLTMRVSMGNEFRESFSSIKRSVRNFDLYRNLH